MRVVSFNLVGSENHRVVMSGGAARAMKITLTAEAARDRRPRTPGILGVLRVLRGSFAEHQITEITGNDSLLARCTRCIRWFVSN
jgi:hypothetical protein